MCSKCNDCNFLQGMDNKTYQLMIVVIVKVAVVVVTINGVAKIV